MSERLRTATTTTRAVDPRREQLTGGGAASAFHGGFHLQLWKDQAEDLGGHGNRLVSFDLIRSDELFPFTLALLEPEGALELGSSRVWLVLNGRRRVRDRSSWETKKKKKSEVPNRQKPFSRCLFIVYISTLVIPMFDEILCNQSKIGYHESYIYIHDESY